MAPMSMPPLPNLTVWLAASSPPAWSPERDGPGQGQVVELWIQVAQVCHGRAQGSLSGIMGMAPVHLALMTEVWGPTLAQTLGPSFQGYPDLDSHSQWWEVYFLPHLLPGVELTFSWE